MAQSKGKQSEFIQLLGPLLEALRELGGSAKPREAAEKIAENVKVSEKAMEETLSSGQSSCLGSSIFGLGRIARLIEAWYLESYSKRRRNQTIL